MTTHTCTKCSQSQPIDQFYIDKRTGRPAWGCKSCRREYERNPQRTAYRKAYHATRHQTPERQASFKERWLEQKYGMTPDSWAAMSLDQGGRCFICGWVPTGRGTLYVDHDHANGRVRGLLCPPCNSFLGRMNDSADAIRRAAAYVENGGSAYAVACGYGPQLSSQGCQ